MASSLSSSTPPAIDRRRSVRLSVTEVMAYVDFGQENGGILLDVSEDGMSVQTAMPLVGETFPTLRLQARGDGTWLDVSGRLAWISETKKVAGVAFVGLSEVVRREIRDWIASEAAPRGSKIETSKQAPAKTDCFPSLGSITEPCLSDEFPEEPLPQIYRPEPVAAPRGQEIDGLEESEPIPNFLIPAPNSSDTSPRKRRQHIPSWLGSFRARIFGRVSFSSRIALVTVLAFAVGLMIGRRGKSGASDTAQRTSPEKSQVAPLRSAQANSAPVKTTQAGNQLNPFSASNGSPRNPTASLTIPNVVPREIVGLTDVPPNDGTKDGPSSLPLSAKSAKSPTHGTLATTQHKHSFDSITTTKRQSLISDESGSRTLAKQPLLSPVQPRPPAAETAESGFSRTYAPTKVLHDDVTPLPKSPNPDSFAPTRDQAPSSSSRQTAASVSGTSTREPLREVKTQLFRPSENLQACQLIHSIAPAYPPEAARLHIEGTVTLRIVVGTDGTVQSVKLVNGPPVLVSAAMDAAREFRYIPASLNGRPIQTIQTVNILFQFAH